MPSAARSRDLNVRYDELGYCRYDDFVGSPLLSKIREIIGRENRRDALHVDSAYKSGCRAFVTQDRDILDRARELGALLGIRFLHPDCAHDQLVGLLPESDTR